MGVPPARAAGSRCVCGTIRLDEADKRLEKPKNHAQTMIHKLQSPVPCLDSLASSQTRQVRFQRIPITGAVIHVEGGASVGR